MCNGPAKALQVDRKMQESGIVLFYNYSAGISFFFANIKIFCIK